MTLVWARVFARHARRVAASSIVSAALLSLVSCIGPTMPRGLEVGDILHVDGTQLVGAPSIDLPLSHAWGATVQSPRVWFIDPRDAVAVSVRVGLRTLDVYTTCGSDHDRVLLPQTLVLDGVRWTVRVGSTDGSLLEVVAEGDPGLVLELEAAPDPNGVWRYRPADADRARRALSFEVVAEEVHDAGRWQERLARGTALTYSVEVALNVANQEDLGGCAVLVAELSSAGTTVWLATDRR